MALKSDSIECRSGQTHTETATAKEDTHACEPVKRPVYQLSQRGYDNLLIFLTTLFIFEETGIPYVLRTDCAVDSDTPKRLRLRLLLFSSVNESFLMALLFFAYGQLDQRTSSAATPSGKMSTWGFSAGLKRLVPAIASKLLLEMIRLSVPSTVEEARVQTSTVNPIVFFPILLLAFDFTTSTLVEQLGSSRLAVYLEQFQGERKFVVPVYWLLLAEVDFFVRTLFPTSVMSTSAFRPTDVPKYFFAYIWGRLSVSTRDVYILAITPGLQLPIISMALSVLFSNLALLDLLGAAIPNLTKNDVVSESVESALRKMGGGLTYHAAMYSVWKTLSFASIAPTLLATFVEHTDQDFSVTIPVVGRRSLKKYAYAAFLLYMPLSRLVQVGVDAISVRVLGGIEVVRLLETHSSIGSGLVVAFFGTLNTILSWMVACIVVECIPHASQIL
ncbi:uncharacterized protein Z520_06843 [Fonsecaea multimorphosa CBS 102226]|uniref:Uncharacterized protein n=1 Tax=Fonsecaea multimorphosa CBS 102226 TaxID=1442371 RepID=A0A0D2IK14_9EURO|nr:uncharacterized protein Z520_06843 [Fonsecaea multimorphosa CBS 102226]KIX97391.1 hypothetical protein Z520_06843 [Fonsecaea multimorphosa CBS 102226]OAL23359.1 hypothetical protein AYO22_06409 [Fonsecaea multimorphosa]